MNTIKGKKILGGKASGAALVTKMPMNFTAAFTKPQNILPFWRGRIHDRHHELNKQDVSGKVLVFPAAIGSTYTGMMLLQVMYDGHGPAAMVVNDADSLMVSGAVLAEVWFKKGIPVVECPGADLFDKIRTGDRVEVDGDTGEVRIHSGG